MGGPDGYDLSAVTLIKDELLGPFIAGPHIWNEPSAPSDVRSQFLNREQFLLLLVCQVVKKQLAPSKA
jgi:hypothetical protein